jgi:hypothetical protein
MNEDKKILDACCGGRMFWYSKNNGDVLFMDKRVVDKGAFANNWNPGWSVQPDIVADFRHMPFPDKSFKMVVFDPPHLTSGSEKSVINKKYGLLNKETWKEDIRQGFEECWRVLEDYGVLIFKWNEANIKAKELVRTFSQQPLFGDFTGKTGKTIWMTFMKMPSKGLNVQVSDTITAASSTDDHKQNNQP